MVSTLARPRSGKVERDLVERELMRCDTDSLDTVPLAAERAASYWQQDIPDEYLHLTGPEIQRRVAIARAHLGDKLVVLGHHYQREDIIQFADLRGDSFKLAKWAAEQPQADYIVFCGVHFMAEAADILAAPHQRVILPNLAAGCSMADMADEDDVYAAWDELKAIGLADDIIPVTYMNSAAALKAFCGENGGIVCTSSNAPRVLQWALARKKRVLFFPDEHLGRNTGIKLGFDVERDMALWDFRKGYGNLGGNTEEKLRSSTLILWRGWCSVHARFSVAQIEKARGDHPGIKVVVHPECRRSVVAAADMDGSTEFIAKVIRESEPGSKWAVGTEINLVSRLARENPDKLVFCLDPVVCPCSTMYRVHPAYLAWVMEELIEGRVVNEIAVPAEIAAKAKLALERMLSIP
ncbi:MAG: quinolinate synthase NadA [Dehalococcoidia bacterium]